MRIYSIILSRLFFSFIGMCLSLSTAAETTSYEFCSSVKYLAQSGRESDIEFIFDKPYTCGRFANGDWWISGNSSGVVTLIAVSPDNTPGLHGMEVNPASIHKQGFDSRVSGYEVALNVKLPLKVKGDASVVKAVSVLPGQPSCRPCLKFAAVLTVTRSPVSNSSSKLRPGYFGTSKVSYGIPDGLATRLPRYPAVCCSEAKYDDFERIAQRYRGVQLDHLEGWGGRSLHPIDNMPDYGASIAVDNAVSALRFLLNDLDIGRSAHKSALINYLQMGVDLHAMAMAGLKWQGNGGHGNGRKLPILFTGHVLAETEIHESTKGTVFSEDEQIYFSEKAGKALYGVKCPDKDYWMTTRFDRGTRDCRDPYGYIDGGSHEIGESYQFCCTAMPWKYTALAVRMLGIERNWANDPFLEYADRWVNEGAWANPDPCAPYNNNPDDYMKAYGAGQGKDCIRGDGRYKKKHGINKDGGHYRNKFGDQMWRIYRSHIN